MRVPLYMYMYLTTSQCRRGSLRRDSVFLAGRLAPFPALSP